MNKLPHFIIPGAAKAGTTSIVAYLRQHPDIYLPSGTGELHFFNKDSNYIKGIEWYESKFQDAKVHQKIGEKTPRYSELYVPERMHKYLPEVKLIWVFRNPVYRAYSHYKMYIWNGTENRSFKEAVKRKKETRNNKNFGYIELGQYSIILKKYLKYYDIRNMKFIIFEEFILDPNKTMKEITDFLGIKPLTEYKNEHMLKAKYPKNLSYQTLIRKLVYGSQDSKWNGIKPARAKRTMFKLLTYFNESKNQKTKIDVEAQRYLTSFYEPFIKELEILIGKDLQIWKK